MFKRRQSLFDQSLDRSVFVTYFLGAIVPLIGFAVLGERFAPLLAERNEQIALIATIVATGVLCLGSFLALRLIVLRTVHDMLQQHERLESLLRVAQDLAEAAHTQMVTETAACWAQRLTGAEASWVLVRETPDKPLTVDCQRGTQAAEWLEANHDEWMDLVERSLETGEAIQIEAQRGAGLSTVFLPLARSSEEGDYGVLVVASDARIFTSMDLDALRTLAAQSGVALTNAERGDSQRNFFSHMTDFVVAALDTHVLHRAGHASRVAEAANRVGRAMGVEDEALHDLHFGALLHDIGMLRIPASKQREPKLFRKHPVVGYKMLTRIRVWKNAAPIVGQHHERVDGAGYPDGLVGDDICLGARILAVCDAWDAMRSDDVHRAAIPVDEALAELRANAGSQFDPDVVSTFESLVREGAI